MAIYKLIATKVLEFPGYDENGNPVTVTRNPGDVISRIVWDGTTPYTPPDGTETQLETSSE